MIAVRLLDPQQLVEVAAHAVDVEAEVDVRVEELGPGGQLRARELVEALDQSLRATNHVFHESESTDGRRPGLCVSETQATPSARNGAGRRALVFQKHNPLASAFVGRSEDVLLLAADERGETLVDSGLADASRAVHEALLVLDD